MNFIEIMKYYVYNIYDPKKVRVNYRPEGLYLYKDLNSQYIIQHNTDGTEELYKVNYVDITETRWEVYEDLSAQTDMIIGPNEEEIEAEDIDDSYEEDTCTQSITRPFVIDTKEGIKNFIRALEESETDKKEKPNVSYHMIRGEEELIEFMKNEEKGEQIKCGLQKR